MNWPISINLALKSYKVNSIIYFIGSLGKILSVFILFKIFNKLNFFLVININLFFTFLLTLLFFIPNLNKIRNDKNLKKKKIIFFKKDFKYYFIHSFLLPFMLSTDILIAKIYFSSEDAAKYIIASSLSKILFFICSGLYSMMFNESLGRKKKNTLFISCIIFLISFMTAIFIIVFGESLIELIYGEKFNGSHKYLLFLTSSVLIISLTKIMCDILIAIKKYGFIKYQLFTYIIFAYLTIFHMTELIDLSKNILISSVFLIITILIYILKNKKILFKQD
jgi:O-antigen/teichoic acid export membrane protein